MHVLQLAAQLVHLRFEQAKLAANRDVGSAVLEAYSRVLEQRLAALRAMSLAVHL